MSAQFARKIVDSLNASPDQSVDALYQDVSKTATMTKKQTDTVTKMLSEAAKIFQKIKASTLNAPYRK